VLDQGLDKREKEHARCLIITITTATGPGPLPAL
jgi:hypothetical protein